MVDLKHIRIENHGHVMICFLSNPPSHTLTGKAVLEINNLLDGLKEKRDLRVLAFTGEGSNVFIKHYEVGELSETANSNIKKKKEELGASKELHGFHKMLLKIRDLDAIVVAGINGNTAGGGCEFSLGCDLRVMSEGEYFIGLPETSVGILPGGGGTQRLARMIGSSRAMDLILHARLMTNTEAFEYGLVNKLLPQKTFREDLKDYCEDLASRAPIALREAKKAIHKGLEVSLEEGLRIEQDAFNATMNSNDAARAMRDLLNNKEDINESPQTKWEGN
jgi:enoyl-CoA hydratase